MKKIFIALFSLLTLTGTAALAQTPAATAKKTEAAAPVTKDGKPDMRYKANKEAAKKKTTAHTKKDGTPDKRYKENKKKA